MTARTVLKYVGRWQAKIAHVGFALAMLLAADAMADAAKPPVPAGIDPGGVAIAILGSGVDYTRPEIAQRLARDGEGEIVGFDLIDRDLRPFDASAEQTGTTIGQAILAAAPDARLAVFRTDTQDALSVARGAIMIGRGPSRIALVTFAGGPAEDWAEFEKAARHFSGVLFVAIPARETLKPSTPAPTQNVAPNTRPTAAENFRFPADLKLDNLLVVAARIAQETASPPDADITIALDDVVADLADPVAADRTAAARVAAVAVTRHAAEPMLVGASLKQALLATFTPDTP